MKETMDGAARNADKVAKSTLPDRPHHLSLFFDRRFPSPDGWWFTGPSAPLQYPTYISAAQRGILTTRAAFEVCDEPPAMPVKLPVKGEGRKKLSLMDYQNRKKSESPVENGAPVKTEAKTNGTVHARPLPPSDNVKRENAKAVAKPQPSRHADARAEKPRPETNGERTKPSQSSSQAEVESRKRAADTGTNPSPQKRVKSEVSVNKIDQARKTKPATPRGREGVAERPPRDAKTDSLHPTVNGLAPSSLDRDRENTASPRSTIQVNGSRPRSDSGTSTPRKPEPMTKSALPELLSPLHPSLFEGDAEKSARPKKKAAEKPSKPEKERPEGPSPLKKAKKPLKIPPLLSPTLPPIVEAALAVKDRIHIGAKSVPSDSSNGGARKTIVAAPPVRVVEADEKPARPSKIVTFKLKKANAKRAKELLSLPSKSAKDAMKKDRSASVEAAPPPAKKRPRPTDDTPAPQETATKRTKPSADVVTAKPAGPSTPLKPGAAAATNMSRVASSQSQGTTPAATTATTGLTPGTSDNNNRPPTRAEPPLDPKTLAQAEAYKERHAEYSRLGGKLKRARDELCPRDRGGVARSPADARLATALHFEMVLAYMVAFHSLDQARALERRSADYGAWDSLLPHLLELRGRVQQLQSQQQQHQQQQPHGPPQPQPPHMTGKHPPQPLPPPQQQSRPLLALVAQMHALCLDQTLAALATLDVPAAAAHAALWVKHGRNRAARWAEAHALSERVVAEAQDGSSPRMRAAVGPWTAVEDAVGGVMGVLRRWAEREGVRWVGEVKVGGAGGKGEGGGKGEVEGGNGGGGVGREKEKEREREREREKDRERDREGRERERERERDRGEKERDRDRERDRERERDLERDRHRDRERDRERERDRDREKDRERDWDRDRARDRDRNRERDRERDRPRPSLNGVRH